MQDLQLGLPRRVRERFLVSRRGRQHPRRSPISMVQLWCGGRCAILRRTLVRDRTVRRSIRAAAIASRRACDGACSWSAQSMVASVTMVAAWQTTSKRGSEASQPATRLARYILVYSSTACRSRRQRIGICKGIGSVLCSTLIQCHTYANLGEFAVDVVEQGGSLPHCDAARHLFRRSVQQPVEQSTHLPHCGQSRYLMQTSSFVVNSLLAESCSDCHGKISVPGWPWASTRLGSAYVCTSSITIYPFPRVGNAIGSCRQPS